MDPHPCQLHIAFFPFMALGHMIPSIDMARLFARHGVKVTIIATPKYAPLVSKTIERDGILGSDISMVTVEFQSKDVGLLKQPLEEILKERHPNCLVADMMFTWATEVAAKFGIPRLVFHGTSSFALCVHDCLNLYEPYKTIQSDFEPFQVPGLPDQIEMTRLQLPPYVKETTSDNELLHQILQSDLKSYGVLVNSFQDLEPGYFQHYRNVMGRKAWYIGPVSLYNSETADKVERGNMASIDKQYCLRWLATKKPNSVLYICFGSMFNFSASQLLEIAMALEASGHNFIWVAKREEKAGHEDEEKEEWLPEGFEKRIEERGLIIRGWAPQMLILEHEAVGGFMTHCGWNSTTEAVTAGVPMATWPLKAEQFFNEKLITSVLKIGVEVGAKEWSQDEKKVLVRKEEIEKAVRRVMAGEEAEEMRNRVKGLKEKARKAIKEGGSSHSDLNAFLDELRAISINKPGN